VAKDESSSRVIRMKADNNPFSISLLDYPITKKDYLGKVVYDIPGPEAFRSF
jgi:hypothetical protein